MFNPKSIMGVKFQIGLNIVKTCLFKECDMNFAVDYSFFWSVFKPTRMQKHYFD